MIGRLLELSLVSRSGQAIMVPTDRSLRYVSVHASWRGQNNAVATSCGARTAEKKKKKKTARGRTGSGARATLVGDLFIISTATCPKRSSEQNGGVQRVQKTEQSQPASPSKIGGIHLFLKAGDVGPRRQHLH
jgi:hypothetical protein